MKSKVPEENRGSNELGCFLSREQESDLLVLRLWLGSNPAQRHQRFVYVWSRRATTGLTKTTIPTCLLGNSSD